MIVMKFGGSAVRSAGDIHRIVHLINQHRSRKPVVVISAFYQVTNVLEKIAGSASRKERDEAGRAADDLFDTHKRYAADLLSPDRADLFAESAERYREQMRQLIGGLALTGEVTARTVDQFSSYGERLASELLTLVLQENGLPAELIKVDDYLYTTADYSRAVPLFNEVGEAVERTFVPVVKNERIPVTPGFIGVTRDGIWTTMGRESSDYTAALLGAMLRAEEVQLRKIVEGIRTADPLLVGDTRPIERLSYDEALDLAGLGAKVLHPRTILPVREHGIPILVTGSGPGESPHTIISGDTVQTGVKSIACISGIDVLRVRLQYHANGELMHTDLNNYLRSIPCRIYLKLQVGSDTVVAVDADGGTHVYLEQLERYGSVEHTTGAALVSIIGEGTGNSPECSAHLGGLLEGLHPGILISGASPRSISAVVPDAHAGAIVAALHKKYFPRHMVNE
jgi:aspartate kinase